MSSTVKRITDKFTAQDAVNLMIKDMPGMWDGFPCDGNIVADRKWGAYVKINIPLDGEPDAWTVARLYRNGDAYVCVADFYVDEGSSHKGTDGNYYTIASTEDGEEVMIAE